MSEVTKLVVGFVGIVSGFLLGLAAYMFIMQRTGSAVIDRPGLVFTVAIGLCGGGAVLLGYVALSIAGRIDVGRKRAARKRKKKMRK